MWPVRRLRRTVTSFVCLSVRLSVRPSHRLPLHGFSLNLVFRNFYKLSRRVASNLGKDLRTFISNVSLVSDRICSESKDTFDVQNLF